MVQVRDSLPVGADAEVQTPPKAALDLHKGICDPRPPAGCPRWPANLRLESTLGDLIPGLCKATNLCEYCRVIAVIETAEMLWLDAMEWAPTMWLVLTAREHLTRKDTYAHLRQLRAAARRRWPDCQWHVQVEFQKRGALHLNLLVKGVPVEDAQRFYEVVTGVWCKRVDAVAGPFEAQQRGGQTLQEVTGANGLVRYLQKELAHGLKREQAPPMGWRGHRTSQTRGYLVRPASVMRQEARASLRDKRVRRRAEAAGLTGEAVERAIYEADELAWQLVRLVEVPTRFDADGLPSDNAQMVVPLR